MTPISAVRELVPTYRTIPTPDDSPVALNAAISSSQAIAELMRPIIGQLDLDEHAWAIYLNGANPLLAVYRISEGSTSETAVSTSKVMRGAILCNAAAFALVHNHPSGSTQPTAADRGVTVELVEAGELMRIPCLDHVIIGTGHFSFADNGLIEKYRKLNDKKGEATP